jgi:peptide/nickel transport system permease protein
MSGVGTSSVVAPFRPSRWLRLKGSWSARAGAAIVLVYLALVAFGPSFAPHDFATQNLHSVNLPPSAAHWMGTDEFGRDVLSRTIYGARISFTVGVLSIAASMLAGALLGALAAYYGGLLDRGISLLVDLTWSFPEVLTALVLVAILGPGLSSVVIAVAVAYLAQFARLMRGQVRSLMNEAYVEASHALGATDWRILARHIVPNAMGPLVAAGAVGIGGAIVLEATFSFLGLGAQPPVPSWGSMLSSGTGHLFIAPWTILFPGAVLMVVVLGFNLLGDAILDLLETSRGNHAA